ncbi:MAG: hypothetical protein GW848_06150 [Rhodoferax sp.]|nr:hypothetical protein [Rhodoferax sp.]OIP21968.1 MAG: hypothetical protein AUK52_07275 [Comamonadaceae bacterium CG2_30_60_41]PIW10250.1 MAG: hypothetical protein COW39_01320 [Comamonadaceae bacterium CG17_big_fil_post_rev_8_21_14_2_50_60_13]PJC12527.1 MAG: hypothetical protein CO066_09880 [Comamonadaceae bacterium CG_4_9_14_0_8_um_filter_60_18]
MVTLAAINSATPSLQSMLIRSRVEQARREADQAEAYAQTLRQQADEQERVGQDARGRAQTLETGAPTQQNTPDTGARAANRTTSSTSAVTQVRPNEPTYLQALSGVFKVAQPLLAMDLSATQKNVVKSSLFDAASTATGRLLNTAV